MDWILVVDELKNIPFEDKDIVSRGFSNWLGWAMKVENTKQGKKRVWLKKNPNDSKPNQEIHAIKKEYSEEDLKEAFKVHYTPFSASNIGDFDKDWNKWFEQFKNK